MFASLQELAAGLRATGYIPDPVSVTTAFVGTWIYLRTRPPYAQGLLAQAYSARRTMELRIPGAHFAPIRTERSRDRSRIEQPSELLEAEAIIARSLVAHPSDPVWLQPKGRADLLEGNWVAALESFQQASELQPHSASLLVDMASAYFQRAEGESRAGDYGIRCNGTRVSSRLSESPRLSQFLTSVRTV